MKTSLSCLFLLIIFVGSLSALQSDSESWFWQYPKPQGNWILDVTIVDSLTVFAVGEGGTLMKSTDGGASWSVRHHVCGHPYPYLHVFFLDKKHGWVAGGKLLVTTDGGEHWSVAREDSIHGYSDVCFINPDTGWIVGGGGIVEKTTDGGATWSRTVLYEWGSGEFGEHSLEAVHFVDAQTGCAVGNGFYGNSIYQTTDGGTTWVQRMAIRPIVYGTKDVQFLNRDTGWVCGFNDCLLRTTDGGVTWTPQRQGAQDNINSIHFLDARNGIAVGNMVGGEGGDRGVILTTSDGGKNWRESSTLPPETALYSVDSQGQIVWAAGSEGTLYRSTDKGETWSPKRDTVALLHSIHFHDEHSGWAVGDSGVILGSTNGGSDWQMQAKNDSISFTSVYALDAQTAFAVGEMVEGPRQGVIMETKDAGANWTRQPIDTLSWLGSITFMNDTLGWMTSPTKVYRTIDRGRTWEQVASGFTSMIGHIQFVDENTGWLSFDSGSDHIFKSIDGGRSWSTQFVDSGCKVSSFFFTNAQKGWAVGEYCIGGKNLYRTIDGGASWKASLQSIISNLNAIYFINERVGWAVGGIRLPNDPSVSTIIKTTDGGETWAAQECPMRNYDHPSLRNVFFLNEKTGWVVGRGIFKTENGGSVVSVREKNESQPAVPKQIELQQNYPNPFNPSTMIGYELSARSRVSLRVYDLLGRLVATLVDEEKPAGSYTEHFDGSGLSSGIYFYVFRTYAGFHMVKKMLLLR